MSKKLVKSIVFFSFFATTFFFVNMSPTPPKVITVSITKENIIDVQVDSQETSVDLVIRSPKLEIEKVLSHIPIDHGRINYTLSSADLNTKFWQELNQEGLIVRLRSPSGNFYSGQFVLHRLHIGRWKDFYRFTQLQGHLMDSSFLVDVPSYLSSSDIDFPYIRKNPTGQEVPFTTQFTINRVLGGLRPDFFKKDLTKYHTKDLAYKDANGVIKYRFDNLKADLARFLAVGYKPSDITLTLNNVPWDLSQDTCADPTFQRMGKYGNRAAPKSMMEWKALIRELAIYLKSHYGYSANGFRFKLASEANSELNFCGTEKEYFQMYELAEVELHKILPNVVMMPAEFAGSPVSREINFATLFSRLYDSGKPMLALARSKHYSPNYDISSTTQLAATTASSFKLVYEGVPGYNPAAMSHEIHQFGILGEKGIDEDHADKGPRQAAWHFMMAMKIKQRIDLNKLSHWELFDHAGQDLRSVVTGTSWLYQIYDHFLGKHYMALPVLSPVSDLDNEYFATAFYDKNELYVMVASYNPDISIGSVNRSVKVKIPLAVLPRLKSQLGANQFSVRQVEYSPWVGPGNYVRNLLKNNLIAGVQLKTAYAENQMLIGSIKSMIVSDPNDDGDQTRKLNLIAAYLNQSSQKEKLEMKTKELFRLKPAIEDMVKKEDGSFILTSPMMGPSHLRLYHIKQIGE